MNRKQLVAQIKNARDTKKAALAKRAEALGALKVARAEYKKAFAAVELAKKALAVFDVGKTEETN